MSEIDPDPQNILQRLFDAADHHAEDTGEDHNIGDLQDLVTTAWELMSTEQRIAFLESDVVAQNIDLGAREEFTVQDLLSDLKKATNPSKPAAK